MAQVLLQDTSTLAWSECTDASVPAQDLQLASATHAVADGQEAWCADCRNGKASWRLLVAQAMPLLLPKQLTWWCCMIHYSWLISAS